MYLARFVLNADSRPIRQMLADPTAVHQFVMSMFPDDVGPEARKFLGVLHRVDRSVRGEFVLLVQANVAPDLTKVKKEQLASNLHDFDTVASSGSENPSVRSISGDIESWKPGTRFVFRLKANATKKINTKTGSDGRRKNGSRVPVRGDEGRREWFFRHAEVAGFRCDELRIEETQLHQGRKDRVFSGALFEGVISVADIVAFRSAHAAGIGSAKAFGFGLLSLHRLSGVS
jgi:CRISPR system Cascade subunit CasE